MVSKRYVEQLERARRCLRRFEALCAGIAHTKDAVNYDDDVYAFFQNCYHLKDWIKNDPYCSKWPNPEKLIDNDQNLQICADLCNAQKHLKLTRPPRSAQNPQFAGRGLKLAIDDRGGSTTVGIAISYNVTTDNFGTIDALVLAKDCMTAWENYISANDP
ncbi:MAG: hypothetical protein WCP99_22000 [Burkholderiales bacterium]